MVEHETDEVLGTPSCAFGDCGPGTFQPDDLFRYHSNGTRSFTAGSNTSCTGSSSTNACLSLDGVHMLQQFNNLNNGEDAGDWVTNCANPLVQDAAACAGNGNIEISPGAEILLLDVIGYSLAPSVPQGPATLVLRDTSGSVRVGRFAASSLSNAAGVFASDPGAAEDSGGNTFVTARDTSNSIWANVWSNSSSTWSGWQSGGGITQGVPSIAVDTSGKAWIASRDAYDSYWLVSFTPASGYGAWTPLLGVFATDPSVVSCGDGSLYVIGKDNYNSLWSGHYIPGSGFQHWAFGGGIIHGKPAATCGGDNAVYVVAEDNYNSNWMARVAGNTWTGWYYGGAVTSVTPRIAALGNGTEAVVILDPSNVVWRTTFNEGTGNGWQPWTQVGGILADVAAAGINGSLFLAGKTSSGDLWWWQQTGSQWTSIGNNGVAAGALAASPK